MARTKKPTPDQERSEDVPPEIEHKALIQEALELQEQITPLQERLDEIKDDLRILAGVGRHGEHLTISPSTRVDQEELSRAYPAKTHPYLYRLALDMTAVKDKLPPEQVKQYTHPYGKDRVSIK